jgi:hypothetical protein
LKAVAERVADLPNIIGFDSLNEPGFGWFGSELSYRHLERTPENRIPPAEGPALSVLDQLSMLAGLPTTVPLLKRGEDGKMQVVGERVMNPAGLRAWTGDCPFEAAGIYRIESGKAVGLREDAFSHFQGRPIGLSDDAYGPFFRDVAATMRSVNDGWALFAEMDPYASIARREFPHDLPERTVNASHWYDINLLHTKDYDAASNAVVVAAKYQRQLGFFAKEAAAFPGGAPAMVGEFGIPYDLDNGEAYAAWARGERNGVWAKHEAALGAMYDALDALQMHSTQWNYTASNLNNARVGDGWNQEDLSIWSADQVEDGNDGARALPGFCRPYVRTVQGRLVESKFDRTKGAYSLVWDADHTVDAPTEVFIPAIWFPGGVAIKFEGDGKVEPATNARVLVVTAASTGRMTLTVSRP